MCSAPREYLLSSDKFRWIGSVFGNVLGSFTNLILRCSICDLIFYTMEDVYATMMKCLTTVLVVYLEDGGKY